MAQLVVYHRLLLERPEGATLAVLSAQEVNNKQINIILESWEREVR